MATYGMDFGYVLANGLTGALGTKFIGGVSTNAALKDGGNHAVANLASQVVDLQGFLPMPDTLAYLTNNVTDGIWYVGANMVNDTCPYEGKWACFLYGTAVSVIANNVTSNIIGNFGSA